MTPPEKPNTAASAEQRRLADASRAELLRTAREIYDRAGDIDEVLEYVDGAIGEMWA